MEWKERIGILSLLTVPLIILIILLILGRGNLLKGDEALFKTLNPNAGNSTPFDEFFILFSTWGPGDFGLGIWVFIPFGVLLLILSAKYSSLRQMRLILILILVGFAVGYFGITTVLKYLIERERPFLDPNLLSNAGTLFANPSEMFHDPSFPSGHATTGFIFATPFMLLFKKRWIQITALIYGVLIGYARIFLGVHFPLDVLVGGLIGIIAVYGFFILLQRYLVPKIPWLQYIEPEEVIEETEIEEYEINGED